ncbi:MAG TPA: DUF2336 domain-containing protein [Bradyrhizobium sp.]|jgi:uncharacterized protein (DUF2336 family)|nr:DUF2336 domain-containing protein [Bradyrhizobium sp.]
MSQQTLSIAEEVETAIAAGSAEKCAETAQRVTALFLASAGSYSSEQIELFGDVFERLVNTIELRAIADVSARIALAELSSQLAPISRAPASVIRHLARHDDISVAGPVLMESPTLKSDDLIEIAKTKGEKHLIAIAGRWWLQEVVTDSLLIRRFPSVSRRLVTNPGARVSAAGFAMIVAQAAADPELAVVTGIRADLPGELRARLLRSATDAVKTRMLSRAPSYLFEEIRAAISAASADVDRELSSDRDFKTAATLIAKLKKEGGLNEAALRDLASQRRYEETLVALAELARTSVDIVRPLMQSLRSDGILVPCRVAGLGWETVKAVLDCRFSRGVTAKDELSKLKRQFAELTADEAARLLKLWNVRTVSPSSKTH